MHQTPISLVVYSLRNLFSLIVGRWQTPRVIQLALLFILKANLLIPVKFKAGYATATEYTWDDFYLIVLLSSKISKFEFFELESNSKYT